MKTLIILSICLLGIVAPFQASAMSDADKDKYLEVLRKGIDGESTLALAIDADGFWTWHSGTTPFMAKTNALNYCKQKSKRRDTCKIVDVDGKSDFIKQRTSTQVIGNVSYGDDHKWCEVLGKYTSVANCKKVGGGAETAKTLMWCATKFSVSRQYPTTCNNRGGKVFTFKLEADAEHQRRAGKVDTAKTTPTTLEASSATKEATDIEFWQSIKDDDNPDLFQAYLDQFPDGAYVSIAKIKINELRGDSQSPDDSSLTERLKTLKQLFESELISSEDYEAKKAELLKEL